MNRILLLDLLLAAVLLIAVVLIVRLFLLSEPYGDWVAGQRAKRKR